MNNEISLVPLVELLEPFNNEEYSYVVINKMLEDMEIPSEVSDNISDVYLQKVWTKLSRRIQAYEYFLEDGEAYDGDVMTLEVDNLSTYDGTLPTLVTSRTEEYLYDCRMNLITQF